MIGPTRAADGARDRTEVLWFDPAAGAKGRIVESKKLPPRANVWVWGAGEPSGMELEHDDSRLTHIRR